MNYFLGFNLFHEQTKGGLWRGFGTNQETKTPERECDSLQSLQKSLEYDVLCYHCRMDMGASYIVDKEWVLRFLNMSGQGLNDAIQKACVDYSKPGTVIAKTQFDGKDSQIRVNVKAFKHYSLCKVLGVFTDPNLLAIG